MRQNVLTNINANGYKKRVIQIAPDKDGQTLGRDAIKKYVDKLQTELKDKDAKIIVRGRNILRDTTLKAYGADEMEELDEDYFTNKKLDPTKFNKFYAVNITIVSGTAPKAPTQFMFKKRK